jgi:hypothetical protein
VYFGFFIGADAVETVGFQHAQQLDLHVERHFRHFIEKQGAAVSAFKAAFLHADCAGEAAAFMTEQARLRSTAAKLRRNSGRRNANRGAHWAFSLLI